MRIGLVGGGSGGHFFPLIAVAEELRLRPDQPELYYFGPTAYDSNALATYNISYVSVPAGKTRRYLSIQNFIDIGRNFIGFFVALVKLYYYYPDVIFSKGGYTSVPILLAATFLRIPIVIHESDSKPGRANRLTARFARYIAISFPEVASYFPEHKTALTGIPIRTALRTPHPHPESVLSFTLDKPLIYVTGGSLGAETINNLILSSLNLLLPDYFVFHQTGPEHEALVRDTAKSMLGDSDILQRYYVFGTIDAETLSAIQTAATVVVTRAGSTTLTEIALHAKPAIVIPIPEAVSHDQRSNAYAYARSGAATVLEQDNLTAQLLVSEIRSILDDSAKYQNMQSASLQFAHPDAAAKIATILLEICHEH